MAFIAPLIPLAAGALGAAGTATAAVGGAGAALSMGATLLSGYGAIEAGKAENRAAQYNATVNDIQARQANEQAALKASEIARRSRQSQASGRAAALVNGFEASGSVVDVLNQAARSDDLDFLTAIYEGEVQSRGFRSEAQLNRARGASAKRAGKMAAGSALLAGANKFYANREARAAL